MPLKILHTTPRTLPTDEPPFFGRMLRRYSRPASESTPRPSADRRDRDAFQKAFLRWLGGLRKELGNVIAIDGKTLRGSKAGRNKPLHIASAWASDQHLTLGQTTVDKKSNEITAIPQLLDSLVLSGAIVTIDAMGCQREIAEKIIERKGHYCLAVKGNQENPSQKKGEIRETSLTHPRSDYPSVSCVSAEPTSVSPDNSTIDDQTTLNTRVMPARFPER